MERCITLGADEHGEVYGLELNEDGSWRRNPLGYSTSCVVIRPMSKEYYEYETEDPESAKDLWQASVAADQTELGLKEWFEEYTAYGDTIDTSFVSDLLDDDVGNPTVSQWEEDRIADGDHEFESFRQYVRAELVKSPDVNISDEDGIYEWEASGMFPPRKPFVVEFAPKELLEEYYAHLRKTHKEFEG